MRVHDEEKSIPAHLARYLNQRFPIVQYRVDDNRFATAFVPNKVGQIVFIDDDFATPARRQSRAVLNDFTDLLYGGGLHRRRS